MIKNGIRISVARWGGLLLGAAIIAAAAVGSRVAAESPMPGPEASGVAVVELFTSEGCSSCPPADEHLAALAAEARTGGQAIFPLTFHVDYWDQLGWKDPWASAANSTRQRDYARIFGTERIYTPQMIVNGRAEFNGADRRAASEAIRAALLTPAPARIALTARFELDQWRVGYRVSGASEDAILNIALTRRGVEQAVPRGENAGQTLKHANVVVGFETATLADGASGEASFSGMGQPADELAVIAYAQEVVGRRVIGAALLDLAAARNDSTLNNSTLNDSRDTSQGASAMSTNPDDAASKVVKTPEEWKKVLSPDQFRVMCNEGTERAFTGKYWNTKDKGMYLCAACGQELFASDTKFDSGTGWPSYWEPAKPDAVGTKTDRTLGMARTEVHCSRCGGHLGHVFEDGPNPTGLRYCINSVSLDFKPAEK